MTKQYTLALCVLLLIVQLTLLKISLDKHNQFELEMDPADPLAIKQSQREQQSNDDFYSHVTNYAHGHSFRDHWLKTRHNESCAFRIYGTHAPCSCCAGAMTYQTAESLVNGVLQPQLPVPVTVGDTEKSPPISMLTRNPFSTMLGIMNTTKMFGFSTNKAGTMNLVHFEFTELTRHALAVLER
jgi:hypothetical protein